MKYILMLAMLVAVSVQAQDYCFDAEGHYIPVPENYKLVAIPAHWDVTEVYRESKRVKDVMIKNTGVEPEDCDELAISPSSCDDG